MRHLAVVLALLVLISVPASTHENWCGYDFVQIGVPETSAVASPPSSPVRDPLSADLSDINSKGNIVGRFPVDSTSSRWQGFALDGAVFGKRIAVPGYDTTTPTGINNDGDIVGIARRIGSGPNVGFRLSSDGNYDTFAIPLPGVFTTEPQAISNNGVIVGAYRDDIGLLPNPYRGFLWDGVSTTTLAAPFGFEAGGGTYALGVNSAGTVVGFFGDFQLDNTTAFLYANGLFTRFDLPGRSTRFLDINDRGAILGTHQPSNVPPVLGTTTSFVLEPDGEIVHIEFPGAAGTSVYGLNDNGEIVGSATFATQTSSGVQLRTSGFTARARDCSAAVDLTQAGDH